MQTSASSARSVSHANGSCNGLAPMQHCFRGRHIRPHNAVQPRQMLHICCPLHLGVRPLQPARFQHDHAPEIQTQPSERKAATGFKEGVVIIGGGPAGLSAAMILAQRGWTDITVVEKRQDVLEEIVDRSYVYRVDGRGLKLLNRINKLDQEIDKYALPMEKINMTVVKPDSRTVNASFDAKFMGLGGRWLPRTTLLRLLYEDGLKLGRVHGWASSITILEGTTMAAMEREPLEKQGEWRLKVTLNETATGKQQVLRPHLVIGADGINSVVRHTLERWETEDTPDVQPGATHRFAMQEYDSPSAGLWYKVMKLPANPPLTKAEQPLRVNSNSVAVLEGMAEPDSQFKLRLGLLPVKDSTLPRSANFILPSKGHKLLNIKDTEQMYQYLESQLPQFPVRSLLPPAEVARFASSRGGRFPAPQHVNALQTSVRTPSQGADAQGYGVVLLGDARAVFPPDCGQGVNSAFEDVLEFEKALTAAGDNLPEALQQYEANRLPDIKALISIMTFAAPYQYNQEIMGSTLWTLNFILRTVLNKLAPAVFAPQAVLLVQQSDLNYREVLKRVNATTQNIIIGATLLAALPLVAITWSP